MHQTAKCHPHPPPPPPHLEANTRLFKAKWQTSSMDALLIYQTGIYQWKTTALYRYEKKKKSKKYPPFQIRYFLIERKVAINLMILELWNIWLPRVLNTKIWVPIPSQHSNLGTYRTQQSNLGTRTYSTLKFEYLLNTQIWLPTGTQLSNLGTYSTLKLFTVKNSHRWSWIAKPLGYCGVWALMHEMAWGLGRTNRLFGCGVGRERVVARHQAVCLFITALIHIQYGYLLHPRQHRINDYMYASYGTTLKIHSVKKCDPRDKYSLFFSVFRIHAILVWIRIRILLFSSLTFKMPTKKLFV